MFKQNFFYALGLDLGIASIGWAVVKLDENENPIGLIDLGVRLFDAAEHPQTGESLNAVRRQARALRRLTQRRASRMRQGRALLKTIGAYNPDERLPNNPWQLRVKGLTEKLTGQEWSAVLLHLLKHRGYLSARQKEQKDPNTKELGKLLSGVKANSDLLVNKHYQTCAELAINEFEGRLRNHAGEYSHTFNRLDLLKELQTLFQRQQDLGNPFATLEFLEKFSSLLMYQKPALSGDAILKMLGYCTFEPQAHKAAKATYSAERFILLTKINNLRLQDDGQERPLTDEERELLLQQAYAKPQLKYEKIRSLLKLSENITFKGLYIKNINDPDERNKAEKQTFMELKAFHQIRKALEGAKLKDEWLQIKDNRALLDHIGTVFSLYKTDDDLTKALADVPLSNAAKQALMEKLEFKQFISLSLDALSNILPQMEQGLRYDEACKAAYGDHYGKKKAKLSGDTVKLPPVLSYDESQIRNPVVLRTLSQCRKVINAIIRQYGMPTRIHVETARELGKSYLKRKEDERKHNTNRAERSRAVAYFKGLFGKEPSGQDLLKMRLYQAQNGKCLYSGKALDIHRLIENNYAEIDHVLPFSRTWDNSFNNKVLVLAGANQNKGNKTPYEWFDGKNNSPQWQVYVARVQAASFSSEKGSKLLTKTIKEEEFSKRNLNDTRYITKFMMNWLTDVLPLKGKGEKQVFAPNGRITSELRGRWGLDKSREENDRHHAMDAIVIACATPAIQQRITNYYANREMSRFTNKYVDKDTGEIKPLHFPHPWKYFTKEVKIRVFDDNPQQALAEQLPDRQTLPEENIRPLFVSRMPKRKISGQGHEETRRSPKFLDQNLSVVRKALTDIKPADLENMVNKEREVELYLALKNRLAEFNDKAEKAFAEPFYKKGGQQVKKIRLTTTQNSGVMLNNGTAIADNGDMARVDLFKKNGKYFLVPVYVWQAIKGILPNKAIVANKNEDEWTIMDENTEFMFSIYPNDLIKVVRKEKGKEKDYIGYYKGVDRANASIKLIQHDKGNILLRIGIKNAISVEKYTVDLLGNISKKPCKKEKRQSFK